MEPIAIIGMAGRFPGAATPGALWANLRAGLESIRRFSREELIRSGVAADLADDPAYVAARGSLDNVEDFDATLFKIGAREAEIIDPQQRLFLECAWEALESAGCDPSRYAGDIGVWAGSGSPDYWHRHLSRNRRITETSGDFQLTIANDKDFLATRVAYKLNLRGPAITVQTACSTSLVSVAMACQSLRAFGCDAALAGGASISLPLNVGYLYRQGMILSPDGNCRAFDADANGTVPADAVGVVVLKRLSDAQRERDPILAVIRGAALNNDGSAKIGFTAPSASGQAQVIVRALTDAHVTADSISYVEAHGTGTELGDPIEIAALTEAYRRQTEAQRFCAIGSVKTNLGHTNAASGVTGLIKTVQCLIHRELPPTLHFERPNPRIDFASSPFVVNTQLRPWLSDKPLRAGVSSFGIGGTNAHVILEEAPDRPQGNVDCGPQLVVLSAETPQSLAQSASRLSAHLTAHPQLNLAEVAHTLQTGRRELRHRRFVVGSACSDIAGQLAETGPVSTGAAAEGVVFLFPGQGSQYPQMARDLYQSNVFFRDLVDECQRKVLALTGLDLLDRMYGSSSDRLQEWAQPAIFVVEYAVARLYMHWGIVPVGMIGHSIGEYAAACIAGVFSLDDALRLVCERNRLTLSTAPGAMLMVPLPEGEARELLTPDVSLAAVNGPALCVLSGDPDAIDELQNQLESDGLACRRLHVARAMHSASIDPILAQFREAVTAVKLNPPQLPFVSSTTGTWIRDGEAEDAEYWVRHLRNPVLFDPGLRLLLANPGWDLLELGPGDVLSTLAKRHPARSKTQEVLSALRRPNDERNDRSVALMALGALWARGARVDWESVRDGEPRYRVPLPTYAFDRQRYWVDAVADAEPREPATPLSQTLKKSDIADWFYEPVWKQSPLAETDIQNVSDFVWLVFAGSGGLEAGLVKRLADARVVTVLESDCFEQTGPSHYTVDAWDPDSYRSLFLALEAAGLLPDRIVHLWCAEPVDASDSAARRLKSLDHSDSQGFYSLMYIAQAIGGLERALNARLCVVTRGLFDVQGSGVAAPERATVLGIARVIPQEYPSLSCVLLDFAPDALEDEGEAIAFESLAEPAEPSTVAVWRNGERWSPQYVPSPIHEGSTPQTTLKTHGVYLITGGFGGIGSTLAEYLAREVKARLVLVGRAGAADTPERIARVQAIEAAGGEVLTLSADVASLPEMQAAVQKAVQRFGRIDGVVHAAGLPAGGVIQRKTRLDASTILDAKVRGTLVLEAALEGQTLDFMLLCSSLTAIIGGFGQADYCAANCFLDAWASARPRTQSVNWDGWTEVGMAARLPGVSQDNFIQPKEGAEVFGRVLASGRTQTLISTVDLAPRLVLQDATSTEPAETSLDDVHPRPGLSNVYVAPRTALEQSLVAYWEKFLGVHPIGVEDDFFNLGGDSLLAVQLLFHIRKETATDLPSHVLAEAPTIAQLAGKFPAKDSLRENKLPPSLVCLNPGSSETRPLFLFHPVGGQVYLYRDLVSCLAATQPVWGIRADERADATNMVSLAAHYLEAVVAAQPHGPYRLGGSSFGGTLAFEIARQFSARNEEVDLLVMIDSPAPVHCPPGDSDDVEVLAYLLGLPQPDAATLARLRPLSTDAQLQHLAKSESRRLTLSVEEARGFLKLWRSNLQALQTYRPTSSALPTLFFQATEPDGMNRIDYHEGWRDLIPKMEVFHLPDTHIGINLMPHAMTSAGIITSHLAKGN